MILKAVSEHCSDNYWSDLDNNRLKRTINQKYTLERFRPQKHELVVKTNKQKVENWVI